MADNSQGRDRLPEPKAIQEGDRLARAFRKLREGRGRETASLYRDIVQLHGATVFAARAWKNGRPGVNQDRKTSFFAATVDPAQGVHPLGIGVGGEELVGRMNLEAPDAHLKQLLNLPFGVFGEARMYAPKGEQSFAVSIRVISRECVWVLFRKAVFSSSLVAPTTTI